MLLIIIIWPAIIHWEMALLVHLLLLLVLLLVHFGRRRRRQSNLRDGKYRTLN